MSMELSREVLLVLLIMVKGVLEEDKLKNKKFIAPYALDQEGTSEHLAHVNNCVNIVSLNHHHHLIFSIVKYQY
jgi:hypothetical protein